MEFSYKFTRPAMLDYYYEIIIEYDKDTADFMEFWHVDLDNEEALYRASGQNHRHSRR